MDHNNNWPESEYDLPPLGTKDDEDGVDGFKAIMAQKASLIWQEINCGHGDRIVYLLENGRVVFVTWYNWAWDLSESFWRAMKDAKKRFKVARTCYMNDPRRRELDIKGEAFLKKMRKEKVMKDNKDF